MQTHTQTKRPYFNIYISRTENPIAHISIYRHNALQSHIG